MSNICVIPCRAGSQRIPNKNRRLFHGKPILQYSIEAAQASGLFSEIYVSSDSPVIGGIARGLGANWHKRSPELSMNYIGTQDVTKHAILDLFQNAPWPAYVACVYATAPMMSVNDLTSAYAVMTMGRHAYAYSTCGWHDAAQFYWGSAEAFINDVPLDHWSTLHFGIDPSRFCDINTEEDFSRAEAMYAALHNHG